MIRLSKAKKEINLEESLGIKKNGKIENSQILVM